MHFPCYVDITLTDKILLQRYVNWSTNFRGLSVNVDIAPCSLNYISSILSEVNVYCYLSQLIQLASILS